MTNATDTLDRITRGLGFMHDAAEVLKDGSICGGFRHEDLGAEGRECESCEDDGEDDCVCGVGDDWDRDQARIYSDAKRRVEAAFPGARVDVSYSEKGWFQVYVVPAPAEVAPAKAEKVVGRAVKKVSGRKVGKVAATLPCETCGVQSGRCLSSKTGLPTQTHKGRMAAARALLTA